MMLATRTCSRASLSALRSCRPSSSYNLAARHLERTFFLSPTRYPPRLPTLTYDSFSLPSSRRDLSMSPTTPRRAQYSRFDDGPNRAPPHSAGIQRRDIIIYTVGAGSVIYFIFQCVIHVLHLISHALISLLNVLVLKSLEQVPETGRWRFMDMSPKFEAAVSSALPPSRSPKHLCFVLFSPETNNLRYDMIALGSVLYRALQSVPRKTPPTLTCHHPTCTSHRLSHPRRERSGHSSW